MPYLEAVRDPGPAHRRAFNQGWNDALKVQGKNRAAYKEPERNTWMSVGYRHGLRSGSDDPGEMDRAWEWSIEELRRAGSVDVDNFE